MLGQVAKAAMRSALTFKLLEFSSSLVSYTYSLAKGFGPFLSEVWAGFREKGGSISISPALRNCLP